MTDVLELLKPADPVDTAALRREPPPRATLEAILAGGGSSPPPRRPARRRMPRAVMPAAGLGLAAVLVAALLVSGGTRPDEAAAAALRQVADAVRAQPGPGALGPGEFLYTRVNARPLLAMGPERPFRREIHSASDFGFSVMLPQVTEMWQGRRRGLVSATVRDPRFPTANDRRAWVAAGRPRLPAKGTFEDDIGGDGIERISLPTDPDRLLDELKRDAADGDHGNAYIFSTLIADYLREPGTTPAQRAALYEVAARLPGIELIGPRADRDGRRGTAFASDDDEGRYRVTLIINRRTGQLLARRSVTLPGNPIPVGTVTEDSTFSVPAVVGAIGERP
jgi:hypothetical protein